MRLIVENRPGFRLIGLLCFLLYLAPDLSSTAIHASAMIQHRTGVVMATTHARETTAKGNLIYFAEGSTLQSSTVSFSETLDLLNTTSLTATGHVSYFSPSGILATLPITIPARTRLSEDVDHDVGSTNAVSAVIDIDQAITASRTISRTTGLGTILDSSTSNGVTVPSPVWYFAEGYTGVSFQEYLAILNPGTVNANVLIQPVTLAGSGPTAPISQTVAAHSRATVNLRASLPNLSLGLVVQADQPIVVERVLYWGDGSGSTKYGAAASVGLRGPAVRWSFPFVSSAAGDQAYLSFTDPTTEAAHVHFTMYTMSGTISSPPDLTVQPGSRATFMVPIENVPHGALAIVASSDVPVVGEEAQYFGGSPNLDSHGGSVVAGLEQPGQQWQFPGIEDDRYTSGGWYILNLGSTTAQLLATFFSASGVTYTAHYQAPPGQLTRVGIETLPTIATGLVSAWTSSTPVVMMQLWRENSDTAGDLVMGINDDQP